MRILSILGLAFVGSLGIAVGKTTLYGVRASGELIRLNPDSGEVVVVGATGMGTPNALALSPTGVLYAANFGGTRRFARLDMATGVPTDIVAAGFADIRDMAFVGGVLFGIRDGGASNDSLVTINPTTGVVATVGTMGSNGFQGLCSFGTGLFAWDVSTGLHTVNTVTGATSDVNPLVGGFSLQAIAFASDGVMYGTDTSGNARRINHLSGESSVVSSGFGDTRGLCGMPKSYRVILRRSGSSAGTNTWRVVDTGTMETWTLPNGGGTSEAGTNLAHSLNRYASGSTLASVDPGAGTVTSLPMMGNLMQGFAYDGNFLYGVSDQGSSVLFRIDTNTASTIPMGSTGFPSVQGLTFVGTQLYGWDVTSGLIRISTGTGAGTDVNAAIGGSANILSLETMPDGTLLGFGDKLYVIDPTTGAFESRGGDWGMTAGCSILISEDADLLGISAAGFGYRATRSGALTATGWSTGLTNWGGLEYGDDGLLYAVDRANSDLVTVNPATGATAIVAFAQGTTSGLAWFRPQQPPIDADSVQQGGDLYSFVGNAVNVFDRLTSTWVQVATLPYSSPFDTANLLSGRWMHSPSGGNWQRLDTPFSLPFNLGAPQPANLTGVEGLPDGTVLGTRGAGAPNAWFVIDPITGQSATSATTQLIRGLAYVGTRLTGTVTLGDYVADPRTQTVTVEFRHRGSTLPVETRKIRLGPGGAFTIACFQRGGYDVAVKGSHWLRKVLSPSAVSNGLALAFGTLTNGDIDGDNEIGIGDYAGLSTAFNSIPGDVTWNPNADLNGDEAVDIADYAILSANYGAVGDD